MSRRSKSVLFVLAHQDDESMTSTRIDWEVSAGHRVFCVFLTDGAGRGADPERRDRESLQVLARLGVEEANVFFLGSRHGLPDGDLADHVERAYGLFEDTMAPHTIERVYCMAYEGGHPDHDVAHMLSLAFARRRGLLGRTWQMPIYNGYRMPWKLFRVHAPLPLRVRRCDRRLPFLFAMRHAFVWTGYPSQWRTWLGIFPDFFLQRAVFRRESIQSVDLRAVTERPHSGPLLYEKLMGVDYERFRLAVDPFVAEHLS